MAGDLFEQINNAVLDLQAADYQGVQRPLRQLSKLLKHPDLDAINQVLTEGVDVDAFLQASEQANNGFGQLKWPDDARVDLALRLLIVRKLGEPDSGFAFQFSHAYYAGGSSKVIAGFQGMNRSLIMPFVRDYKTYVLSQADNQPRLVRPTSRKVFIVHGHDGEARETVARFLSTIGFEPIILHEQPNKGRTVIEKVEAHSDVGFAVVLLTPDDVGRARNDTELVPRARQNVLLELGYFIAKLGRERVCALKRGEVLIPSDFAGVVWEDMDGAGGWKSRLGRELEAAGQVIDWNKVMRA